MSAYQTPDGFVDTPYIYVYDGTSLTDGVSYQRLSTRMEGDFDFILRRVAGLNSIAESLTLYNGQGQPISSAPIRAGVVLPIAPESQYSANGEILFDLVNVARSNFACATTIYTARLAFQGVKRRRASAAMPEIQGIPFSYAYDLTVDWYRYVSLPAAQVEAPRPIYLEISDYDFWLHGIRLSNADGTALATGVVELRLYDDRGRSLSSAPVPQQYLNSALITGYGNCFPVPSVSYRRGAVLRLDVASMICNTDPTFPRLIRMELFGVRRVG